MIKSINYTKYMNKDEEALKDLYASVFADNKEYPLPRNIVRFPLIKKVIFNPPATVVLWNDGSKTIVKTGGKDEFNPETGLAMAIAKRYFGSRSQFQKRVKEAMFDYDVRNFKEKLSKPIGRVVSRNVTDDGLEFTIKPGNEIIFCSECDFADIEGAYATCGKAIKDIITPDDGCRFGKDKYNE